jgi:adenosylcobinamide-GDP ribazoletransferase
LSSSLIAAISFLTTLPVHTGRLSPEAWKGASQWFSFVGLLLGAALATSDYALRLVLPDTVAAVVLLATWVALTGALHWDGLLDCLDALLVPVQPERRLEILQDVHTGAFALAGGGLVLLLYATCLATIPGSARVWALLLAPTAGRWIMTVAQSAWPYARDMGLGKMYPANRRAVLLGILPLLPLLWGGTRAVLVLLTACLAAYLLARWMARQLGGGLTGDCYGTLCEITQLLVLVGYVVGHD